MSIILWREIVEIADKVCINFNLSYGKIMPEVNKKARKYAECFICSKCTDKNNISCKEKEIYIRVHQLNHVNKPLSTKVILRTLAHELAHLKVWRHGKEHKDFENEIVSFMKDLGYKDLI